LIRCREKCLIVPDCSEQQTEIRLAVVTDIAANICLVIYWYVGIAGEDCMEMWDKDGKRKGGV